MRCAAAVRLWSETAEDLGAGCLLRRARPSMLDARAQLSRQRALEASKRRPCSCCRVVVAIQELQELAGSAARWRGGEPVADRAAAAVAL
eukprot:scaffold25183_cov28-Phaeocystis_antarctica.AAC.2